MKYLFLFLTFLSIPGGVWGISISDYYVDLEIQDNAHMLVSEQITYVLEGETDTTVTHAIPLRYSLSDGKRQSMVVRNPTAVIDGEKIEVVLQSDDKNALMAIPLPMNKTLGQVSIELTYTVEGVVAYYDINNEIVWPVFSSDIDSDVSRFAGSIRIPSEFKMLRSRCIVMRGEQEYPCSVPTRAEGGFVSYFAHMGSVEGDTIILDTQFDTGVEVTVRSVSWNSKEWVMVVVGAIVVLVALGLLFVVSLKFLKQYISDLNKNKKQF